MVDRLNKPNKGVQDWHKPVNENFEEVEEASYVERTVADFEGGTLPDAFSGDTGQFSVQSNIAESGAYSYSLKGDGTSSGTNYSIAAKESLDNYVQAGDKLTWYVQLTDTDDRGYIIFARQGGFAGGGFGGDELGYSLAVNAADDEFILSKTGGGADLAVTTAPISSHLNEWLKVECEWGVDGIFTFSITDSTGSELASANNSANPDTDYKSGGVGFRMFNGNTAPTVYFDSWTVERRETEARTNNQKGTTQLGNEVVPSGSIQTGPTTSSTNAKRAIYQDAPVDSNATQGTQSKLTLLQSGLNPAMFMERTLDGQGGAYGHQLQAPLGRISKVNNRLDFNYEDKSDVGFSIDSSDQGGTGINAGILDGTTQIYDVDAGDGTTITPDTRPREIGASYHFSDGDGRRTTVIPCPIPIAELGAVRVTFHGVTTNMNQSGSKDSSVGVRLVSDGDNSIRFENTFSKVNPRRSFFISDGKVAIEADAIADEYRFVDQGNIENIQSANIGQFVRPAFVVADDFHTYGYGEIRIKQITVEPLPEVL